MKRFLLPLLAALVLPTAINAESYELMLAREQWPKMQKLKSNARKFIEMGDMTSACSKMIKYDTYLEMNFEGLQELHPDADMFALKKGTNDWIKKYC